MLSKEEFIAIIEFLKEKQEASDEIDQIVKKHNVLWDDFGPALPLDKSDTIIVRLLEKMFGLPENDYTGSTLSWWIWEMEYGKKFKVGDLSFTDSKTGETINPDLSTVEQLYDFLLEEGRQNTQE